jgi:EAL domain-containing protein (putative c-di-GMP-specific phosphodiesterase class I)
VLQRACADAKSWPRALKVSVNLSAIQFTGRGPVPAVAAALAASGLDPARLELEITETVMLDDTAATLLTLGQLKALGVSIALDDFGTGYSSLSYLRKFPFDRVKIDKSFIADLGQSAEGAAIVEAVTGLCQTLGMATTVEGVETEAQMQELQAGSCSNVQGYLFSKPRPANEVAELCRTLGPAVLV